MSIDLSREVEADAYYRVLGPIEVYLGDDRVIIDAPISKMILASLILHPNRVLSTDHMILEIWGESPPRRAVATIHVYISRLRKLLVSAGISAGVIVTRGSGYLMNLSPQQIDAAVFEHLMKVGRKALEDQSYEDASRSFDQALALWRGPVLGQVRCGPMLDGIIAGLNQLHLECYELAMEAKLGMEEYGEVVGAACRLIGEYPLHEPFYRQLMVAMCFTGRRADALAIYRRAWDTFTRELGVEPTERLQELQHAALGVSDRLFISCEPDKWPSKRWWE